MKTTLIMGPPGTGKTTTLVNILKSSLKKYKPYEIAYLSFTRKAAYEARDRVITQVTGFAPEEFLYISTIHSITFNLLGLSTRDMFGYEHAVYLGRKLGVDLSNVHRVVGDDDLQVVSFAQDEGSIMLAIDNFARIKCITLREAANQFNSSTPIDYVKLEWFCESYSRYKKHNGILDFTDILEQYIDRGIVPKLKVVIIDEAQDLSSLQWRVIEKLTCNVDKVYIAGDDDQAIYEWAGADVDNFLHIKKDEYKVLGQSYRLPRQIYEYANQISSRIENRYQKDWLPNNDEGSVSYVSSCEELPLQTGNWMILCRNKMFTKTFEKHCWSQGFSYKSYNFDSSKLEAITVAKYWEKMRNGSALTTDQATLVYKYLRPGTGVDKKFSRNLKWRQDLPLTMNNLVEYYGLLKTEIWHKSLEKINPGLVYYIIGMLRQKEPTNHYRILISTIHAVKGAECDNVVVCPDMTNMTHLYMNKDHAREDRVFYVATTRAKKALYLLYPKKERHYTLP